MTYKSWYIYKTHNIYKSISALVGGNFMAIPKLPASPAASSQPTHFFSTCPHCLDDLFSSHGFKCHLYTLMPSRNISLALVSPLNFRLLQPMLHSTFPLRYLVSRHFGLNVFKVKLFIPRPSELPLFLLSYLIKGYSILLGAQANNLAVTPYTQPASIFCQFYFGILSQT